MVVLTGSWGLLVVVPPWLGAFVVSSVGAIVEGEMHVPLKRTQRRGSQDMREICSQGFSTQPLVPVVALVMQTSMGHVLAVNWEQGRGTQIWPVWLHLLEGQWPLMVPYAQEAGAHMFLAASHMQWSTEHCSRVVSVSQMASKHFMLAKAQRGYGHDELSKEAHWILTQPVAAPLMEPAWNSHWALFSHLVWLLLKIPHEMPMHSWAPSEYMHRGFELQLCGPKFPHGASWHTSALASNQHSELAAHAVRPEMLRHGLGRQRLRVTDHEQKAWW